MTVRELIKQLLVEDLNDIVLIDIGEALDSGLPLVEGISSNKKFLNIGFTALVPSLKLKIQE